MRFLIAGLGNPGLQYEHTRHNIGFDAVQHAASGHDVFHLGRYAWHTSFSTRGKEVTLIKPSTFMNLSGDAVAYWMQSLHISPTGLLVVEDDIALPFGKLLLRPKGGHGGHNGLKHITERLKTDRYARLRIGIGNDFRPGMQSDYVLSKFDLEEQKEIPALLDQAAEIILSFIHIGAQLTMTKFNKAFE